MARVLLLLVVVFATLGLPTDGVASLNHSAATAAVAHDDCCPDTDPTDDSDCCDEDFGRCCAGAGLAVLDGGRAPSSARSLVMAGKITLAADMLLPRANGPPPTPPPIA